MAYNIRLDGTTKDQFKIGLNGLTFDTSSITVPWTMKLPSVPGAAGCVLSTTGNGQMAWATLPAAAPDWVFQTKITVSSTAPASPAIGDVWVDIS